MFHVMIKRMCMLLSLCGQFYTCQIAVGIIQISYILAGFLSTCSVDYLERGFKVSTYNGFEYFYT